VHIPEDTYGFVSDIILHEWLMKCSFFLIIWLHIAGNLNS